MLPTPRRFVSSTACTLRTGALLTLLMCGPGLAAESDLAGNAADPFAGVEEMTVTGTAGIGALTESSISVTSFDSGELEALGVGNISDVAAFTPNLEIRTTSATTATFFIRGVGLNDFTANASGAVAVYVDDAPRNLPAIQLGLLYDLEGVEVLKGPQGSGPGRNASAGAIRIVTRKPKGDSNGYARIDYGNYNLIDAEAGLESPVLVDSLSVRAAFRVKVRDGIVKNRCGGRTAAEIAGGSVCRESTGIILPGLEEDLNNTHSWSTRISTRWVPPVADMDWTLTAHVDRVDQLGTVGQQIGASSGFYGGSDRASYTAPEIGEERAQIASDPSLPACDTGTGAERRACRSARNVTIGSRLAASLADRPLDRLPFEGDYNNPGFERQTSYGALLHGTWQLTYASLTSVTSFERYDRDRVIDADYSPNTFFEFAIEDDAWQFSQDLRLRGELERFPIEWKAGAFYLQESLDYDQGTIATGGFLEPLFQAYVQDTSSFGVFGDIDWDFLDDFTLHVGARYNWERKHFDAQISTGLPASDQCTPNSLGVSPPCTRTVTVDHPTGTIGVDYRFDESRNFYIKYSHGWKGAQLNARSGIVGDQVTDVASPEVIDAFELGFNGSWLEDRLSLSAALFWYDYSNYQVFTFTNDTGVPPTRIVINANDAQLYGAELETRIEPFERFIVDIRAGWLESRFLDFTDSVERPVPDGGGEGFRQVFDFNGNSLPNAPRFKVSGSLEYTLEIGRLGRLIPRYDFSWTDDVFFDPSEGRGAPSITGEIFLPDGTIGQEALLLQNVRLTYENQPGTVQIAGWVRNLTNEVYKTLAFDASGGPGFIGNLVGDPRTYGISAQFSY